MKLRARGCAGKGELGYLLFVVMFLAILKMQLRKERRKLIAHPGDSRSREQKQEMALKSLMAQDALVGFSVLPRHLVDFSKVPAVDLLTDANS